MNDAEKFMRLRDLGWFEFRVTISPKRRYAVEAWHESNPRELHVVVPFGTNHAFFVESGEGKSLPPVDNRRRSLSFNSTFEVRIAPSDFPTG